MLPAFLQALRDASGNGSLHLAAAEAEFPPAAIAARPLEDPDDLHR